MRKLPPLSALRAFEAAARHGSFRRAADELSVTPTAISHQVRSLEALLSLKLFTRKVRKVELTEAGRRLFPVLRDGFDSFQVALEGLGVLRRRTQVTIAATQAFTVQWLVPRVASFQRAHPDIDLQLLASDDPADLSAAEADIAIRYGQGPYPGLHAEVLFTDIFGAVCSPNLQPDSPRALASAPLIHFKWKRDHPGNPTWDAWFAKTGVAHVPGPGQLRFSDEGHAIQAAISGQGIAMLSLPLVARELADGRLVRALPQTVEGHTYHLVALPERLPDAAVGAALDWLRHEGDSTTA